MAKMTPEEWYAQDYAQGVEGKPCASCGAEWVAKNPTDRSMTHAEDCEWWAFLTEADEASKAEDAEA